MYIYKDLWIIIKDYLIHNIKNHGKHLKNNNLILKKNEIIESLPKKKIPHLGPRIYYDLKRNNLKVVKYIYKIYLNEKRNLYKLIIEIFELPKDYKENNKIYDEEIRENYYSRK